MLQKVQVLPRLQIMQVQHGVFLSVSSPESPLEKPARYHPSRIIPKQKQLALFIVPAFRQERLFHKAADVLSKDLVLCIPRQLKEYPIAAVQAVVSVNYGYGMLIQLI
ncbi:hypothetical protein D3C81_1374130 [compost metagenome]